MEVPSLALGITSSGTCSTDWQSQPGEREHVGAPSLQRLRQLWFPSLSLEDFWGNQAPAPSSSSVHFLIPGPSSREKWPATVSASGISNRFSVEVAEDFLKTLW